MSSIWRTRIELREVDYRIVTPRLGVLGCILADYEVRVHDLADGLEVDGLIGMDVLAGGRLIFDTPEYTIEFHWTRPG